MYQAESPRWMPLKPCGNRLYRGHMSVPIAIDKAETKDAPVESAIAEFFFRGDLACRIGTRWIGRVILAAWMRCTRIVDESGACHDEASLGSVRLNRGDQVFSAIEIG